jgi:hypothetical protein
MAYRISNIGGVRRPLLLSMGFTVVMALLSFAVFFRDQLAEEFDRVKPDGVVITYCNDHFITDERGNKTFETDIQFQSEEPFQLRLWWEPLTESGANDLLAYAETPAETPPPGSTAIARDGRASVAVPRSATSSGSDGASAQLPPRGNFRVKLEKSQGTDERHLIGSMNPKKQFIGHKYVLPVALRVSTQGIQLSGEKSSIESLLPLPRREGNGWQLVSVWGAGAGAGAFSNFWLSRDVPKSQSMLFIATDPETGTREIRAFYLWLELASVEEE